MEAGEQRSRSEQATENDEHFDTFTEEGRADVGRAGRRETVDRDVSADTSQESRILHESEESLAVNLWEGEPSKPIPVVRGVIERRILANYRVRPEALARVLPPPFRPKTIHGWGVAGICLIRLRSVRPRALPSFVGLSSENAAHRIAVEWDHAGETREGVYIPRRDTSSRLNTMLGGRFFPGEHHRASFRVQEGDGRYSIEIDADDGSMHVAVVGRVAESLPENSIFRSLDEASAFFERGALGYSVTAREGEYDGLELKTFRWAVRPLEIERVESSFFDDATHFPAGTAEFDCALLMQDVEHEWHGRASLCCPIASDVAP